MSRRRKDDARPSGGQAKYTDEQHRFILEARLKHSCEYAEVAARFSKKFGRPTTMEQMRHAFRTAANSISVDADGNTKAHPYEGFVRSAFDGVRRRAKSVRGRAFITAASPVSNVSTMRGRGASRHGTNVFAQGLAAVKTWASHSGGEIVILPMAAHMPALTGQPSHYDPALPASWMASEFVVNEHLRALDVRLNPQQVLPLTGMYRIRGGRAQLVIDGKIVQTRFNQSLIFAHSKQDMEAVATGNGSMPRVLYSTGSITLPEYRENRIGHIAQDTHVLGGLIVEWEDDIFWVRQVQFAPDGSFYDIDGFKYGPGGAKHVATAAALRPGDVHAGREAQPVLAAMTRLAALIDFPEVFVEDVFDGASVNPHSQERLVERALSPAPFRTLAEEITYSQALLHQLRTDLGPLRVVASNHHDFLERYLQSGRYVKDPVNFSLAHHMVGDLLLGKDPLRLRLDPENEYLHLGTEDDYYVEGVQMGGHGHLGPDGARGSSANLERVYGRGMVGHRHAPGIRGGLFHVGHVSVPRHGYNRGPSSWLNTGGIVWPGGQMQLFSVINGRYCLDDTP